MQRSRSCLLYSLPFCAASSNVLSVSVERRHHREAFVLSLHMRLQQHLIGRVSAYHVDLLCQLPEPE